MNITKLILTPLNQDLFTEPTFYNESEGNITSFIQSIIQNIENTALDTATTCYDAVLTYPITTATTITALATVLFIGVFTKQRNIIQTQNELLSQLEAEYRIVRRDSEDLERTHQDDRETILEQEATIREQEAIIEEQENLATKKYEESSDDSIRSLERSSPTPFESSDDDCYPVPESSSELEPYPPEEAPGYYSELDYCDNNK